ncbi:hypothetical protein Y032_0023g667 [Ancylostoma ceylanicum]|nr:hypothetical protein Y032_0023g667 [Ancylostoma ceylanicum]
MSNSRDNHLKESIKQISEAMEEVKALMEALMNMYNKGQKGSLFRDYMNAFPGPVPQYPQPPQKPQDGYEYPVLIIPESSFYSKPYPGYPHPGPEQVCL